MAGKELQKNLDQSAFKKNENVYAYYGAIDTTLARKNISEEFWANIGEHLHKQGFKYMVARYSHIASYKLTMKLGGEHVGTVTVED